LDQFTLLDDTDILATVKMGVSHADAVLSQLCTQFMSRKLYHVELSNQEPTASRLASLRVSAQNLFGVSEEEANYFVFTQSVVNSAYDLGGGNINILMKDGTIQDITMASDLSNLELLTKKVEKFMVAYPKVLQSCIQKTDRQ